MSASTSKKMLKYLRLMNLRLDIVVMDIDLSQVAYKYFGGVDLMDIEGLSHSTVMMSEVGPGGLLKFPTGSHFASWLSQSAQLLYADLYQKGANSCNNSNCKKTGNHNMEHGSKENALQSTKPVRISRSETKKEDFGNSKTYSQIGH